MIWAFLTSLLESINTITYKMVCNYSTRSNLTDSQLYFVANLGILPLLFLIGLFPFSSAVSIEWGSIWGASAMLLAELVLVAVLWFVSEYTGQISYRNEKVSVLLPYATMTPLFTVILGFLLFPATTPLITFIIGVSAGLIIVLSSIDWSAFSINRYCLIKAFGCLLDAGSAMLAAHVLLQITEITFTVAVMVLCMVIISVLLFFQGQFFGIFRAPHVYKTFTMASMSGGIWTVKYLLVLTLIRELGVVTTTLFSMLEIAVTLIISWFMLKEKPTKKDIALAVFIVFAVFVSVYTNPNAAALH